MRVFTIGFTKKPAEHFFAALCGSGAERIVDVRLNNTSQLAGFSKREDLAFFLREICGVDYVHLAELAPTQELRNAYRSHALDWRGYERAFLDLMQSRQIEKAVRKEVIAGGCLLCSEDKPERCHRRLVAEYLAGCWGDIEIVHLT